MCCKNYKPDETLDLIGDKKIIIFNLKILNL